jgi:hypothetical protein
MWTGVGVVVVLTFFDVNGDGDDGSHLKPT